MDAACEAHSELCRKSVSVTTYCHIRRICVLTGPAFRVLLLLRPSFNPDNMEVVRGVERLDEQMKALEKKLIKQLNPSKWSSFFRGIGRSSNTPV